jgi:chorismate dehydratase
MSHKFKISIVNYTNTLPFKWALQRSALMAEIELQEDIPSVCAGKLKSGEVDLALVPIALLPELPGYYIESEYCIGADGKVDSVKLYSDVPMEEISEIMLDYHSKTSVTLVRVLSRFFWKIHVLFSEATPGFEKQIGAEKAAVVIGDRTFALNGKFKYEYDLAEEWKKFTGMPFVFAVWASRERMPEGFIARFDAVLKEGVENLEQAVEEAAGQGILSKEDTLRYLRERIDYKLPGKLKAMRHFYEYMYQL